MKIKQNCAVEIEVTKILLDDSVMELCLYLQHKTQAIAVLFNLRRIVHARIRAVFDTVLETTDRTLGRNRSARNSQ